MGRKINDAAKLVRQTVDPGAKIIFGAYYDRTLKAGQLKVTLVATGFSATATNSLFGAPASRTYFPEETVSRPFSAREDSNERTAEKRDPFHKDHDDDDYVKRKRTHPAQVQLLSTSAPHSSVPQRTTTRKTIPAPTLGTSRPSCASGRSQAIRMKPGQIIFDEDVPGTGRIVVRYPRASDTAAMLGYINTLSRERTFIGMQGKQLSLAAERAHVRTVVKGVKENSQVQLLLWSGKKLCGYFRCCVKQGSVEQPLGRVRHIARQARAGQRTRQAIDGAWCWKRPSRT